MPLTQDELQNLFRSPFRLDGWKDLLHRHLGADQLLTHPRPVSVPPSESERGLDGTLLGEMESDGYRIGLFDFAVPGEQVKRRRVGLRNLLVPWLRADYDAALVSFHSNDPGVTDWRVSYICDLKGEETAAKRFTFVFGSPSNAYRTPVTRFLKLAASCRGGAVSAGALREAFSVEALGKEFYTELFDWFEWAVSPEAGVTFPNNPATENDDRENIQVKIIRLITRLLFVWFIRQKRLVPDALFEPDALATILKDFDPHSATDGKYYNAILQNLFFGTLNTPIYDDETGAPLRAFAEGTQQQSGNLYRYAEMFAISKERVVELFSRIPYMNGGLFECLDKPKGLYPDEFAQRGYEMLYDGFSRNAAKAPNGNYKRRAFIPNELFFADEAFRTFTVGDASETRKVSGLLQILRRYNFTVEENTPTDVEVSLDPELLGRVFENLLASYNPETQKTARNSTGSFYTPREIVDYMVEQAIGDYMAGTESLSPAEQIARLKAVKILDPACGSGAYPMGCLITITDRIEQLSKQAGIPFNRYQTKLDIIDNCIYGVDIQAIAMMISKLRFFISLICEQNEIDDNPQDNFGMKVLPNLETKFVAANSLLTAKIRTYDAGLLKNEDLLNLQAELMDIRRRHFDARKRSVKLRLQREDKAKCREIKEFLMQTRGRPDIKKIAEWEEEIAVCKQKLVALETPCWRDMTEDERRNAGRSDALPGFGSLDDNPAQASLFRIDINEAPRRSTKSRIKFLEVAIETERRKEQLDGFEDAAEEVTRWKPYDQVDVSPFFDPEWMFGVNGGFDIVIGNPPYLQVYKGIYSAEVFPYSEGQDPGKQNLYKVFVEHGYNMAKPHTGVVSYIVQSSLMGDMSAKFTRDLLLSKTTVKLFIEFPKNAPTPAGKVFKNVLQGTCIVQFTRNLPPPEHHFLISIHNDISTVGNFTFEPVAQCMIEKCFPQYYEIPLIRPGEWGIIDKVNTHCRVADFLEDTAQGNINTIHLGRIASDCPTKAFIAKGAHIHRWEMGSDLIDCRITNETRAIFNRNSGSHMILTQNISGTTDKYRINAMPFDCGGTKIVFLHTVNILFLRNSNEMKFVCSILNAHLTDWVFRLTSTNNHLNIYELIGLPVPNTDAESMAEIITIVDNILATKASAPGADVSALEGEIDTLIYRLYGLTEEEIAIVEKQTAAG